MKITIHDRLDAVGSLPWDALLTGARLRSPFLSELWQREWVRAFAPAQRLEIRCVEDDRGRLVALLPLYEARPGALVLVGGADVSDYLDLIALEGREEEAWMALLESRGGAGETWELHAVPEASPTVTLLPRLAAACGISASVSVEERCPVVELPDSWDAYLAGLGGKDRHELLRKLRRFEREAPDGHAVSASRPGDVEARFGDFLDLHRRSRTGKARFMDARMEGFFRRVAVGLAEVGMVRLWFLDTRSGPAAAFFCLEWAGTVAVYNSGFHTERAALSPGLVLLAGILRDAIQRRVRRFDFLRGEERYKYEFGPTPEAVYGVTIR